MKAVARLVVVTAVALAPVAATSAPAYACTDPQAQCLVRCVQDLVAQGTCRL
jgi:hypothetical protein